MIQKSLLHDSVVFPIDEDQGGLLQEGAMLRDNVRIAEVAGVQNKAPSAKSDSWRKEFCLSQGTTSNVAILDPGSRNFFMDRDHKPEPVPISITLFGFRASTSPPRSL